MRLVSLSLEGNNTYFEGRGKGWVTWGNESVFQVPGSHLACGGGCRIYCSVCQMKLSELFLSAPRDIFFSSSARDWTLGLAHAKQVLCHLSHAPSLF
jgi:hypothetical protein